MENKLLVIYSWIKSGSQRQKIIKSLKDIKTPKDIQNETKLKFSNISDCLNSFKERKIVNCLNLQMKKGRIYELTNLGKQILKEIEKLEN